MSTDPAAPAWILDIAENVANHRLDQLQETMQARGEDVDDEGLWQLRRSQLDSALATRVIPAARKKGSVASPQELDEVAGRIRTRPQDLPQVFVRVAGLEQGLRDLLAAARRIREDLADLHYYQAQAEPDRSTG